jgi:hypothetical protein
MHICSEEGRYILVVIFTAAVLDVNGIFQHQTVRFCAKYNENHANLVFILRRNRKLKFLSPFLFIR